jgi:hypothetical protein
MSGKKGTHLKHEVVTMKDYSAIMCSVPFKYLPKFQ